LAAKVTERGSSIRVTDLMLTRELRLAIVEASQSRPDVHAVQSLSFIHVHILYIFTYYTSLRV